MTLGITMKHILRLFVLFFTLGSVAQQQKVVLKWPDVDAKRTRDLRISDLQKEVHFDYEDKIGWNYIERWKVSSPVQANSQRIENIVYENVY